MKVINKQQKIMVDIDDILATTDNGIWVRVTRTGKPAWVSRRQSAFFNKSVQVPIWLAEKIGGIPPIAGKNAR